MLSKDPSAPGRAMIFSTAPVQRVSTQQRERDIEREREIRKQMSTKTHKGQACWLMGTNCIHPEFHVGRMRATPPRMLFSILSKRAATFARGLALGSAMVASSCSLVVLYLHHVIMRHTTSISALDDGMPQ